MSTSSAWPNVVRIAWSTGGIAAINEPGRDVRIQVGFGGATIHSFRIDDYKSLFAALIGQGLRTLGATFAQHAEEFQGLRPAEFRAMSRIMSDWPVWESAQKWRQIAVAAARSNEMRLMDVASRVASGLRYAEMRLSDLANVYGVQLRGRFRPADAKDYEAFKDLNSFAVYKAIHALFWELAVLRDALAEFVAAFCYSQSGLRSMSGLIKFLKAGSQPDGLKTEILKITDPTCHGWIATFSSYRDLFTHLAPMELLARRSRCKTHIGLLAACQSPRFTMPYLQMYKNLPRNDRKEFCLKLCRN
jgi:hypothetical protein